MRLKLQDVLNIELVSNFQWLRDEFTKDDVDIQSFRVIENLLSLIDPIYDAHCVLLREIELRLSNWEPPFIGDIMSNFCENLQVSIFFWFYTRRDVRYWINDGLL